MRVLTVGDSFMPVRHFAVAFATIEEEHDVVYLECDDGHPFTPTSASDLAIREYLGSPDQLIAAMEDVNVLVVHGAPVTDRVLDASRDLRLVCCARGGPVNVDLAAVATRGIPLVHTPGKNAESVADMTLAFIVMLARRFPAALGFLAGGGQLRDNFDGVRFFGHDLVGHTLGLVGYGRIGRRVAERAVAFGMTVLAYDPFISDDTHLVQQVATIDELLERSDFVSLHARATSENHRMIDAARLAAMRPGAFLINTAREQLVDEDALEAALDSGHLGGVALDVFEPSTDGEPTRFLRHENVVLTPHIGGATYETLIRGAQMISAEIERFASGLPLEHAIQPSAATP